MHIDHRQIRCFLEVAAQGSINGAAKALHISQSALSRRMSALEHSLGVHLFLRTARGIDLTMHGRSLVERAELLIADLHEMQPGKIRPTPTSGKLRIGILAGICSLLLPLFMQKLSELGLDDSALFESSMPVLREQVRKGALDIAILGDPSVRSPMAFRPIWRERLFLVTPSAQKGASLEELPFLMTTEDPVLRTMIENALARVGQKLPRRFVSVTPADVAKQLIRDGLGYSILHYSIIAPDLPGELFRIEPLDVPPLVFGALYLSKNCDVRIDSIVRSLQAIIQGRQAVLDEGSIIVA